MDSDKKQFLTGLLPGVLIVFVLWIVLVLDEHMNLYLWQYGVEPREVLGLRGIVFMPFIHGDWKHLFSNSLPLFILMGCLFNFYRKVAWESLLWMFLMTGIWTWVIAREGTVHIGASGIIYALVTFLFCSGVLRRDKASMVVALVVTFLYGSFVWGVLPIWKTNMSWEGHLSGALSGIAVAVYYRNVNKAPRFKVSDDLSKHEALYGPEYWKQNNDSGNEIVITYHYKPTETQDSENNSKS